MDTFVYCVTNIGSHGSLGFHPATFQWAQVEKRGSARYWWEGEGCLIPTLQWPLLTLPGAGHSLGETPFELRPLAAAVGQVAKWGECPDRGQVAFAAVGRQHS